MESDTHLKKVCPHQITEACYNNDLGTYCGRDHYQGTINGHSVISPYNITVGKRFAQRFPLALQVSSPNIPMTSSTSVDLLCRPQYFSKMEPVCFRTCWYCSLATLLHMVAKMDRWTDRHTNNSNLHCACMSRAKNLAVQLLHEVPRTFQLPQ